MVPMTSADRPRAKQSSAAAAAQRPALAFATDVPALAPSAEFLSGAAEAGLSFDEGDLDRLGRFLAMLLHANTLLNLTAITEPAEAWRKHILDALTLLPVLAELPEGSRVADVGSGGGVPAIPLAITLPTLKFTLIEATGKKAEFLRAAAAALKLSNVEVRAERAEAVAQDHKAAREQFDAVTARALGPIAVAAELTVPLAKVGGQVLLVKGQKADEELAAAASALKLLGASHAGTLESPTGRIVVLEKSRRTPRDYPRRPGEPKRSPLA